MDKTSIALGVYTNTRVVARTGKNEAYIKAPGNQE